MPIDYKKYPDNWLTEIRPAILERANHCCEECGVENGAAIFRGVWNNEKVYQNINGDLFKESGEFIMHNSEYEIIESTTKKEEAIRIVLTISHTDHNTENNDYSNLKALCQLHHLRHDKEHHGRNSRATIEKKKGLQRLF